MRLRLGIGFGALWRGASLGSQDCPFCPGTPDMVSHALGTCPAYAAARGVWYAVMATRGGRGAPVWADALQEHPDPHCWKASLLLAEAIFARRREVGAEKDREGAAGLRSTSFI